MNDHNLEVNMTVLEVAVRHLREEINVAKKAFQAFPATSQDIELALLELFEADKSVQNHFVVYSRNSDPNVYDNSQECRDDWSKVLSRKEKAVNRLIEIARLLKDGESR